MAASEGESLQSIVAAFADGRAIDWEEVGHRGDLSASQIRALRLLERIRLSSGLADAESRRHLPLESGFEVLEEIGRGAHARVYRAVDRALGREVALKVVDDRWTRSVEMRSRFIREARALAALDQPGIVRIHSIDESEEKIRLSLELVRGKTLDVFVRLNGRLAFEEAARIGIELCRALSALHARGLVHRDLKPTNVMRDQDGRIVLLDFGVVRSDACDAEGAFSGTPRFMAPEQFEGSGDAGPRVDIFALGVLLYWMVSGEYPFDAVSYVELRERVLAGRAIALADRRPGVPSWFSEIVSRALARDPRDRFESASEVQQALWRQISAAGEASGVERISPPASRIRTGQTLLVIASILVLAVVADLLTRAFRRDVSAADHESHAPATHARAPSKPLQKIFAADAAPGDGLGEDIAISGDTFVVGAPLTDGASQDCGCAYVYRLRQGTFVLEAKLAVADAKPRTRFGCRVCIDRDRIFVGTSPFGSGKETVAGEVFVFARAAGEWKRVDRLVASAAQAGDRFGGEFACDGDLAVIGACGEDGLRGAAYVFRRDAGGHWAEEARLEAKERVPFDCFGTSVAIRGRRVVVATGSVDGSAQNRASAQIFELDGASWVRRAQLEPPDIDRGDSGLVYLALEDEHIVLGLPYHGHWTGGNPGASYVFHRNADASTWICEAELISPTLNTSWEFGYTVATEGPWVVCGALRTSGLLRESGVAWLFHRNARGSWQPTREVFVDDPTNTARFGSSVAIGSGMVIVGAAMDDGPAGEDQGSVYVFSLDELAATN